WLPGLQRVLNPFQRLALARQLQERFTLEVEQVLFTHHCLVRQRAAGEDIRQRTADDGIVLADPPAAQREVNAELERRQHAVSTDDHAGPRRRTLIPLAHP